MSKALEEIRTYLREITDADRYEVYQGSVAAINGDGSIDVEIDSGLVMPGVRLRVVSGTDRGIVITPSVGAQVVFTAIEGGSDHQLISASEIDRLYLRTGAVTMDVRTEGVIINEGNLGGLPKIAELKQELARLETNHVQLLNAVKVMAATLNGLSPGISAAFEAAVAGQQAQNLANLENTKLKQ